MLTRTIPPVLALCALSCVFGASATAHPAAITIPHTDPLIYYHGRWDAAPATWWASSGLKLHVEDLKSLALTLGPNTTAPALSISVSVDYGPFVSFNASTGKNEVPLAGPTRPKAKGGSVVRVSTEGWQNNRMHLESIQLNAGARLLPYTPQKTVFQFIGDSLSAGQYLPQGVTQAWPFVTAEALRAEHRINAQPGATLTDMESYGNVHGVSYEFFRTEDDEFFYTPSHNYTTPWNFARDVSAPTHFVVHIGANDASWAVPEANFTQTYLTFLARVRALYPGQRQPIFVFTPWGWPSPTAPNSYYYPDAYADVVKARAALGDHDVFLVNTTGWVDYADVFPGNIHPNVAGHQKIAGLFEKWLVEWGLRPEASWRAAQ